MANPHSKTLLLRVLLIAAATFWVFAPVLHGDWLMDDDFYITQNALLNDPARLWKIWFAPGSLIEYYPIEASVQAVQWQLWGMDTLGYHLTSVVLHLAGALLVWRLLAKFGLRLAWLGGFLFAVHPAVVESVAWISELKNTLSLPLFLLSICAWIDYEDHGNPSDYLLALALFIAAMLSKISMALFPIVILLYAWWKRGRITANDFVEAAPFFVVSLVLGLATVFAGNWFREDHLQSLANPEIGGFADHVALAGESLAFYFSKCVWPVGMSPIYPQWSINPLSPLAYSPWLALGAALIWFWSKRNSWGRHALLGFGFFVINLLPFIGLTSVSYMSFTWVMDHFLYLPLIGLVGLAVAGLEQIEELAPVPSRPIISATAAVGLVLLAWGSQVYAQVFVGPESLWSYTVAQNPGSWLAHNNLGNIYLETNRAPLAIDQYQQSLQINPNGVEAHSNLGFAYNQMGRTDDAIANYRLALKYNPHFPIALAHLADALVQTGQLQEAEKTYEEALLVNPHDDGARASLTKLKANLNESSP